MITTPRESEERSERDAMEGTGGLELMLTEMLGPLNTPNESILDHHKSLEDAEEQQGTL